MVPLTGREPITNPRRGSQAKGAFRKVSNNNQWYLRTDARKLQGQPTVEEWEQWVSKTAFVILLTCTLHIEGVCVWVVNTLNSGSGGPGFKPCHVVSLDKKLYSTLSLFTRVYKWVPVTYCWGVTLRWTSNLSRESSSTPRHASC